MRWIYNTRWRLFEALGFLIHSQKEKVGSMRGGVGWGDGRGASW
jgi:hypothetical protein